MRAVALVLLSFLLAASFAAADSFVFQFRDCTITPEISCPYGYPYCSNGACVAAGCYETTYCADSLTLGYQKADCSYSAKTWRCSDLDPSKPYCSNGLCVSASSGQLCYPSPVCFTPPLLANGTNSTNITIYPQLNSTNITILAPENSTNSTDTSCEENSVESQECHIEAECEPGLQTRTCINSRWTAWGDCSAEACPSPTGNAVYGEHSCTDSDSGLNFFVKGAVSSRQIINAPSDHCSDSRTLTEFYCAADEPGMLSYTCPQGYSCSDGACVKEDRIPPTITINSPVDGASYRAGTRITSILDIDVKDNSGMEPEVEVRGNSVISKGANTYSIAVVDSNGNRAAASFTVFGK